MVLPTFADGGTHVNLSRGLRREDTRRTAPTRSSLLEYLVSDRRRSSMPRPTTSIPVKAGATIHPLIAALGPLKVDALPIARYRQASSGGQRLVDKVGFDR